jgi:Flp pilus assembly protein TadG
MGRFGAILRRYFSGNLGRLARDRRGAVAVEYALLSVPFFTIIFAIIETGYIFFAAVLIEGGTAEAARQVRTGAVQASGAPLQSFRTILCANLLGVVPCNELVLDVRNFDSFGNANPPPLPGNNAGAQFAPGAAGDVVVVRVSWQWNFITPFIDRALANADGGVRSIVASAAFQNEPF